MTSELRTTSPTVVGVHIGYVLGLARERLALGLEIDSDVRFLVWSHHDIEELLSGPQRDRGNNGRRGEIEACLAVQHVHAHICKSLAIEESVFAAEQKGSCDEILCGSDNRGAVLGGCEIVSDPHQSNGLGASFFRLRDVKVHFVTVEIGVVRIANTLVESESSPRANLDKMGS